MANLEENEDTQQQLSTIVERLRSITAQMLELKKERIKVDAELAKLAQLAQEYKVFLDRI